MAAARPGLAGEQDPHRVRASITAIGGIPTPSAVQWTRARALNTARASRLIAPPPARRQGAPNRATVSPASSRRGAGSSARRSATQARRWRAKAAASARRRREGATATTSRRARSIRRETRRARRLTLRRTWAPPISSRSPSE